MKMNGKMQSKKGVSYRSDDQRAEILNPFVHKLELDSTYDKLKTALFTVILLPFRVIVICGLVIAAWALACIGLHGLTDEDLRTKPMTGWRRKLRFLVCGLMRVLIMFSGFHNVRVRGKAHRASVREAPVLCVAPHSSFFDAIAMVLLDAPSVVAKAETARLPFFGKSQSDTALYDLMLRPIICLLGKLSYLAGGMAIRVRGRQASRAEAPILVVAPHSTFLDSCIVYATKMSSIIVRKESMDNYVGKLINYTQPVYVWRDDPNSRQNTIKEIIERATCTNQDWPQVLIFPEGTCTNRSCLITFKPGGFYPGVPVQPVTIRYPNNLDTVTWTWEGPGALKLLWLTLTQVHSSCEIEFLPVYHPSAEEQQDPKLYARNVRDVMAKALGIPVLDYTYDDCRLMTRAKHLNIPGSGAIVEIQKLRCALGLEASSIERHIVVSQLQRDCTEFVDCASFAQRLGIHTSDVQTHKLYDLFKQKQSDLVVWRDYLMCATFLTLQHAPLSQLLLEAFKIYDTSGTGRLNILTFTSAVTNSIGMCQEDALNTFQQADQDEKGFFTADDFLEFAHKKTELSYLFNNN